MSSAKYNPSYRRVIKGFFLKPDSCRAKWEVLPGNFPAGKLCMLSRQSNEAGLGCGKRRKILCDRAKPVRKKGQKAKGADKKTPSLAEKRLRADAKQKIRPEHSVSEAQPDVSARGGCSCSPGLQEDSQTEKGLKNESGVKTLGHVNRWPCPRRLLPQGTLL